MSKEIKERMSAVEDVLDLHAQAIEDIYDFLECKQEVVYEYTIDHKRPETVSTWSVIL